MWSVWKRPWYIQTILYYFLLSDSKTHRECAKVDCGEEAGCVFDIKTNKTACVCERSDSKPDEHGRCPNHLGESVALWYHSVQFFIAIWNTITFYRAQLTAMDTYYPIGNSTSVSDFLNKVTVGIPSYKLASIDPCNKWQRGAGNHQAFMGPMA